MLKRWSPREKKTSKMRPHASPMANSSRFVPRFERLECRRVLNAALDSPIAAPPEVVTTAEVGLFTPESEEGVIDITQGLGEETSFTDVHESTEDSLFEYFSLEEVRRDLDFNDGADEISILSAASGTAGPPTLPFFLNRLPGELNVAEVNAIDGGLPSEPAFVLGSVRIVESSAPESSLANAVRRDRLSATVTSTGDAVVVRTAQRSQSETPSDTSTSTTPAVPTVPNMPEGERDVRFLPQVNNRARTQPAKAASTEKQALLVRPELGIRETKTVSAVQRRGEPSSTQRVLRPAPRSASSVGATYWAIAMATLLPVGAWLVSQDRGLARPRSNDNEDAENHLRKSGYGRSPSGGRWSR